MAMDNPSYFTVPRADNIRNQQNTNPFKRVLKMGVGTSSESVMSMGSLSLRHHEFVSPVKDFIYESSKTPGNDYLIPNNQTSPRSDPNKRSFRSLLRSLSANSGDPQSILHGEPRPSDIAPANHSAPFHVKKQGHTRNASMRSCTEIKIAEFQQALLRRRNRESGNSENFHTMPVSSRRRHSTGAYLSRDKVAGKNLIKVTSVPSEVPKEVAPKVSHDGSTVIAASPSVVATKRHPVTTLHCAEPNSISPPPVSMSPSNSNTSHRKKRARCLSMKEMESIIVIACNGSPEAKLWSDYLISCFNKLMSQRARQHYKVFSLDLEELTEESEDLNAKIKKVSSAKLQLLIMCPKFLNHVEELNEKSSQVMKIFQQDKVLTMLLGITDESLTEDHRRIFPSYDKWRRMEAKEQDNVFVDNFLSAAIDMLSKRFKPPTEKASFSIIPKKIKPGQNRVIALLNEPISSNDSIKITVDKKGDILQITTFKERNPYTLQFDIPDCCLEVSMLVWIKIEKNGVPCGSRQIKCESRLRELDQILRASDNPLEFMCQTLGFKTTDRDQLDNWMLAAFQRNIPAHFNLLSSTTYNPNNKCTMQSFDEYPTLLHFAARFGLERLCWQLLECPGGEVSCDIKNVRHLTPADLAQAHGFPNLASNLRGFMQMNEFTNMYYYLKNMSEDTPETLPTGSNHIKMINVDNTNLWLKNNQIKPTTLAINSPDSIKSDPFSDECIHNLEDSRHVQLRGLQTPDSPKTPASPKFSTSEWLYENDMNSMTSSFHSFTSQNNVQKAIEHDYLIHPSNRRVESTPPPNRPQMIDLSNVPNRNNFNLSSPLSEKPISSPLHQEFFDSKDNTFKISIPSKPKNSHDLSVTTPTGQDELAEIINDFKNNVFTISEVEKLVLDWRNRNETQQSLKEKEEQLNKMREEYDKLQKRIKEEMKRPTPFERVKKIFSKGKSKNPKSNTSDIKKNGQRPNSGLSLHSVSSSSSGRLSTASGGSLIDSGTQSDNEAIGEASGQHHKFINRHENNHERLHLEDYLIPPPPRPCNVTPISVRTFHMKNDPLPAIPSASQVRQEYMNKPHYTMDTINEKELNQENCNQDTNTNVGNNSPLPRCINTYQSNDHQYMNVSPAR